MNRTHRYLILAAVLGLALIGAAITSAAEKSNSVLAFEQLASLVGEWKGVQGNTEIKLTYTLTANGSALMEESQPAGEGTMITMFTVDGDHLIATHYCIAGNQPQMVTTPITEPLPKSLHSILPNCGLMSTTARRALTRFASRERGRAKDVIQNLPTKLKNNLFNGRRELMFN